mmetsp:Transcript_3913/g.10273  ORF Transcript_3913/g.10273 Transcript_3913/m.10273 type:complete len:114 (+) Transcript_3913:1-342(+)
MSNDHDHASLPVYLIVRRDSRFTTATLNNSWPCGFGFAPRLEGSPPLGAPGGGTSSETVTARIRPDDACLRSGALSTTAVLLGGSELREDFDGALAARSVLDFPLVGATTFRA